MPSMVHSADKNEPERPPSMDTVPKLPQLACAQPQAYSANPYEIDLSFRNVDIMTFQQQSRRRNQGYRSTFQTYAEWEKNYIVSQSESSECDSEDSDDKKGSERGFNLCWIEMLKVFNLFCEL
ncbi:hypothetical protein MAR_009397 [Mya arenaria]|uniref:Uncharacterized protein n=1 Tax=Mya arenaria TaxID=6604 RepID=A0ABY7E341_MYAAR|nr:hypothetical protein MAR_009397 [Mya arenaria]